MNRTDPTYPSRARSAVVVAGRVVAAVHAGLTVEVAHVHADGWGGYLRLAPGNVMTPPAEALVLAAGDAADAVLNPGEPAVGPTPWDDAADCRGVNVARPYADALVWKNREAVARLARELIARGRMSGIAMHAAIDPVPERRP